MTEEARCIPDAATCHEQSHFWRVSLLRFQQPSLTFAEPVTMLCTISGLWLRAALLCVRHKQAQSPCLQAYELFGYACKRLCKNPLKYRKPNPLPGHLFKQIVGCLFEKKAKRSQLFYPSQIFLLICIKEETLFSPPISQLAQAQGR